MFFLFEILTKVLFKFNFILLLILYSSLKNISIFSIKESRRVRVIFLVANCLNISELIEFKISIFPSVSLLIFKVIFFASIFLKYALLKLLETTSDMPYSYNNYGYKEDLDKITDDDIKKYYDSVISDDIIVLRENLAKMIKLSKDKALFRKMLSKIYPNYYFREVDLAELKSIITELESSKDTVPFSKAFTISSRRFIAISNVNSFSIILLLFFIYLVI